VISVFLVMYTNTECTFVYRSKGPHAKKEYVPAYAKTVLDTKIEYVFV